MKKKIISATGPNGTFKGEILVTTRTIFKKAKVGVNKFEEKKKTVHDIQTTVNDHLFGAVLKNIEDDSIFEVELVRTEGLLMAHLNKLAKTDAGIDVKERMTALGFKESQVATKERIDSLSEWIQAHTKRVGFDSRRGPRGKSLTKRTAA